jgi:hypothetical protein
MRHGTQLTGVVLGLVCANVAHAQQMPSPPAQFDMLGFIESATLDATMCPQLDPVLWGGTVTLNGITMIVPCNTIVQMPATSLTWAQLFDPAVSAPVHSTPTNGLSSNPSPGQTGLALADAAAPFPSFEIRAIGNVVKDASGKGQYVIGLIAPISQQGLNLGVGTIGCIDYVSGFLYVGGVEAQPGQACTPANGARVQMNDPVGRFGLPHSPDPRFTADTNNPTMHAATGYPICVPRTDPILADDPLCPKGNRPLNGDPRFPIDPFLPVAAPLKAFDMPRWSDGEYPDARQQLPLVIGDWIEYSGTLAKDAVGVDYVSAHTINANLGVFTAPSVPPAYVGVEAILLGTGGAPIAGIKQEATTRIFIVGFTTDPTALVDIEAVDVHPCTGAETMRLLGTVDPASQPVRGRFRFHVLGGAFMPPTREMLVMSHTGGMPLLDSTGGLVVDPATGQSIPVPVANGLWAGQYRLPNFDFIFAENQQFGQPTLPNNFQDIPFLAQGSGPLFGRAGAPVVGQLAPWPGSPVPPPVACNAGGASPVVSAGTDFAVGSGKQVTLAGTFTYDPNAGEPIIQWTQTAGPLVALAFADTLAPTFTAPEVTPVGAPPIQLTFQLSVTDAFGTSTSSVNVTVVSVTDAVTAAAVWRGPRAGGGKGKGVGGQKGGKLSVTATSSVVSATVNLDVVGFGSMTNLGGGNYSLIVTGVASPPDFVTVRSSLGGSATVGVVGR